jgi:hypothetical protein
MAGGTASSSGSGINLDAANAVIQSNSDLSTQVTALMQTVQTLTDQNTQLTAQIQRLVVNKGAG